MIFSSCDNPADFLIGIMKGNIAGDIVLRQFLYKTLVGELHAVGMNINNRLRQVFFKPFEDIKEMLVNGRLAAG